MDHAIDIDATERRDSWRLEVECNVYCSTKDEGEVYSGTCTTLSGSGISFICEQSFDVNQQLVLQGVAVVSDHVETSTMSLEATVVRCRRLKDGRFEIGAKLIHPKDD